MTSRLSHFLILLTLLFSAGAQVNQDLSIIGTPFNAIIPQDTKNIMSEDEDNRSITFYEVIYNDSLIDARHLKSVEPRAEGLKFTIVPPQLDNYDKISTLVGFIYESKELVHTMVWLKVVYEDGKKRFYTDYNQDRNYKNDIGIVSVRNITTSLDIPVMLDEKKEYIRVAVQKTTRKKYVLQRFKNQPVLDLGLGVGSGELTYSFDNYSYLANVTTKSLRVSASYFVGPFVLGLRSTIQNSNFYATYEYIDGEITHNVNRDKHPLNQFQVGGSLAVRIPLSRTIEALPLGTYGYNYYFDPRYFPNRFSPEFHQLDRSAFYEVGLRLNFVVGNQRAIYLLGMRSFQEWAPNGLGGGSVLTSDFKTTRFEVGYSIGL